VPEKKNKSWLKWENRLGTKSKETRTSKKRDELLQKLLTLGERDPEQFGLVDEAPEVGPMYRRPMRPKVVRKIEDALEQLEEAKEKLKKKKDIAKLDKVMDFFTRAKESPEKDLLLVNPGRHPSVLAHEVGHASRTNLPAKFISGASTYFADNPGVGAISSLMGLAGGALNRRSVTGAGIGIGALRGLTRLTEEGRASLKGLDLLRQSGYEPTPEEKKVLRRAWASYLAPAALDTGIPAIMAGLGSLGRFYAKHASEDYDMETALEALARFREKMAASPTAAVTSSSSASSSGGGVKVEGPKMSTSFNTPTTGHMGIFKGTGLANTSRLKVGKEEFEFPWGAVTTPTGLLTGAGIGGLTLTKGNPRKLLELLRKSNTSETAAKKLLGPLLVGGGIGAAGGSAVGSYLENRMPKEGALTKFALGLEQPNMVTKSLRSAAGREGGYTAGNMAKGSGAFKPTRATSTFTEGKSSAMDKM
jgi:hypothetical protein